MAVIHNDTYAAFKQPFLEAIAAKGEPGGRHEEHLQILVDSLNEAGYDEADRAELLPYARLFVEEVQRGEIDPFPKGGFLPGLQPQHRARFQPYQRDLFSDPPERVPDSERALIEQLIAATQLYNSSDAVQELLAFTTRLREFAPFNAMLLHIQKPGLTHAATAEDWWTRFRRVPKPGTRPLLVMRSMGPVDFVFDILDTEGDVVPVDAFAFPTFGNLSEFTFTRFKDSVTRQRIDLLELDAGDGTAGWIQLVKKSTARKGTHHYQLAFNRNHPTITRFVTIAHELAHLFLGHLGADPGRRVPDNRLVPHALREVEAEMVAYLVARRNGIKPRSESYLSEFKGSFRDLNLYAVMRAANAVESALGISAHHLWRESA